MSSDNWMNDLNESNKLFLNEVWPKISRLCGSGDIKPVEILHNNEIAKELDVLCGIDIWQTIEGAGARGIASRVQNNTREEFKGNSNWGTFTIRLSRENSNAKTEYHKRKEALETGRFIYPYLTCQSYFDFGSFVGVGIAKTKDIFNAINIEDIHRQKKNGNAIFTYVYYDEIKNNGGLVKSINITPLRKKLKKDMAIKNPTKI